MSVKAYMTDSDSIAERATINPEMLRYAAKHGEVFPTLATLELGRILGDTERKEYHGTRDLAHLALTVYADYRDRDTYRVAHDDLARAIENILPELDRLEANARHDNAVWL